MKRLILLLLVLFPASAFLQADEPAKPKVAGLWMGTLKVGNLSLKVAFQIDADKDGKLSGKLISLDQGNAELPFKNAKMDESKFTVEMPAGMAEFAGTLNEKATVLKGEFTQAGKKFPLELSRIEKLPTSNRPQHPKAPFPYEVEDVTFVNAAAKIKLAGTLTKPKGDGPFPAVVLVTGSGPQDRDETIFGHKPFLVIADHLTKEGFAVLRYDDRGTAKSEGEFSGATTDDFANDASAALTFLQSRKEIDSQRIGMMGHSEGGLIAPIVASKRPKEIAFIVLLAGPGVTGAKILETQTGDVMKLKGDSADKIELALKMQKQLLDLAKSDKSDEDAKRELSDVVDKFWGGLTEKQRKDLDFDDLKEIKAISLSVLEPWMRHFIKYDPVPTLQKVSCDVLALNGKKDCQVRAKENLEAIEAALKAGKNANRVTLKALPKLNHLFQECKTGAVDEYATIEETFNPEALKFIAEWLAPFKKKK